MHTRNCLCSLTARSCKWKINNSMSCWRGNNATLQQAGPCFTVSLESVPHGRTALPFGLYLLLMWMLWISRYFGVQYHPFMLEFLAKALVLSAVIPCVQLAGLLFPSQIIPCTAWAGIAAIETLHLHQY